VKSVVGAVILDAHQRAFIQRRSAHRRLFPDCWDIVGGHIEPGETPAEALRREITEETGWELREIVLPLGDCTWVGTDGETRHESDFLVAVDGDLDKPELEWDKHPEYRWISAAELDVLLENRKPGDVLLRDILANAFRTIKAAGLP
jgi:8-oxo-dGTP pyrophosphatase MutT (NUDIX family)